jgi:DNA-binding transcriptional ArsR family regulator
MLGGCHAEVIAGSRLSEAVFGLRSIRRPGHPHVDSPWFRETFRWSQISGELLTALCSAPSGSPRFLLDRVECRATWSDELCGMLAVEDAAILCDIRRAFRQRVPSEVSKSFVDVRAGLAAVISQLDDYVSKILEPLWLRVSMALSAEVQQIQRTLPAERGLVRHFSTLVLPTALGGSLERFDQLGQRLVSLPIADPGSVFCPSGTPSVPVSSLIGQSRTVILYALEDASTISELAHLTGQRRANVVHHLEVLRGTNLVDAADVLSRGQVRYRRTALAELLLSLGANVS